METKESNPKDAVGVRKAPLHNIPCEVEFELGLAMLEGARKYGSHNYRKVGVRASVYYDAVMRHMKAWWEGEDYDPESGTHHLVKAMACETVARDSMHMGNFIDDRPIRLPLGANVQAMNKLAAEIIDRYPEAKAPFTNVSGEQVIGDGE